MKIRITTNTKELYYINVENNNFEDVVKKILEQKYVKLDKYLVLLTSCINEIKRVD